MLHVAARRQQPRVFVRANGLSDLRPARQRGRMLLPTYRAIGRRPLLERGSRPAAHQLQPATRTQRLRQSPSQAGDRRDDGEEHR